MKTQQRQYSNQFSIRQKVKRTEYDLYYGNQKVFSKKTYSFCAGMRKKLKLTGNYNLQKFEIR